MTTQYKQNSPVPWRRGAAISFLSLLVVSGVYVFVDAQPQAASYFAFADGRTILGVKNFCNVLSNAAFLIPGIAGLAALRSGHVPGIMPGTRFIYVTLFAGVVLTAFGSAWFHLVPDNASLVWDRLPMTIVFMSLSAAVIAEHISRSAGRLLLLPLLALGVGSVAFWAWTEARGMGDLRPYGLVQFLPMLLIPAVALSYPSYFDRSGHLLQMYLLYALAKLAEHFDAAVYAATHFISGHSLKHIIAACAVFTLFHAIRIRRPV